MAGITVNDSGNELLFDFAAKGCGLCGFSAHSLREALQHLAAEHSICDGAIGFFLLQEGLGDTEHRAEDAEVYDCAYCVARFNTYKGMKQHVGKVHLAKNKQVRCVQCGGRFKHKYALRFHVKQVHESSTRVKCPECEKQLYNKYSLKKHLDVCRLGNGAI